MRMLRAPENCYEVVHIPDIRDRIACDSFRKSDRTPGRYSLVTGWYLVIRPGVPDRRDDILGEYLGPFGIGSDASAAIAAIDSQFACHA
jgi:hypothetical protein